jgi:hypothetical protein
MTAAAAAMPTMVGAEKRCTRVLCSISTSAESSRSGGGSPEPAACLLTTLVTTRRPRLSRGTVPRCVLTTIVWLRSVGRVPRESRCVPWELLGGVSAARHRHPRLAWAAHGLDIAGHVADE